MKNNKQETKIPNKTIVQILSIHLILSSTVPTSLSPMKDREKGCLRIILGNKYRKKQETCTKPLQGTREGGEMKIKKMGK